MCKQWRFFTFISISRRHVIFITLHKVTVMNLVVKFRSAHLMKFHQTGQVGNVDFADTPGVAGAPMMVALALFESWFHEIVFLSSQLRPLFGDKTGDSQIAPRRSTKNWISNIKVIVDSRVLLLFINLSTVGANWRAGFSQNRENKVTLLESGEFLARERDLFVLLVVWQRKDLRQPEQLFQNNSLLAFRKVILDKYKGFNTCELDHANVF